MLGDQRVDGGHAGDVDDGDLGFLVDDRLEQVLHNDAGAGAVERADQGQGENAVPETHDRGREFGDLIALPVNHLLAALEEPFHRVQPQLIERLARRPRPGRDLYGVVRGDPVQGVEDWLLEREHEVGGICRREPLNGARAGDIAEGIAQRRVGLSARVGASGAQSITEQAEHGLDLVFKLGFPNSAGLEGAARYQQPEPSFQDRALLVRDGPDQDLGAVRRHPSPLGPERVSCIQRLAYPEERR